MKILYIILIVIIPLVCYGFPKIDYLKLNRHYFKDRKKCHAYIEVQKSSSSQ